MNDLIEALTIFKKYLPNGDNHNPTICEHDVMYIMDIEKHQLSIEDEARIEELGFFWDNDQDSGCYISYRFGSA